MGLRAFLLNVAKALALFALAIWLLGLAVTRFPAAFVAVGYPKEWAQVAMRIEAAEKGTQSDTLYIGDSVGGQIVPFNDSTSLCTNGAVMPIGNYVLLARALDRSPSVRTVIYIGVPQALANRFERTRTCNNFLKPFLQFRYAGHFDASLEEKFRENPLARCYFAPPAKVLPLDDLNLDDGAPAALFRLSDFSAHWLAKADSLCHAHDVAFLLRCPPMGARSLSASSNWSELRAQVAQGPVAHLFQGYFASMRYLPDSLLRDELHWKEDFVEAHRVELLRSMLSAN